MDGNLLSTMSAGAALQVFMAGFIFRECCDIKAVLENIGPILIVVSLTISNAILVKNFMMVRGGGQKIVTHPHLARSDFQVSNNSRLIQQREVPMKPNDSFLIVSDVPSYEFPSSLIDLSGTYKLESKSNYEEFLASQGVGWAIRKAAMNAVPTNVITHDLLEHTVTIRVEGIISSQTTYIINGDPIETQIQSRVFSDTMKYLDSGDGVQVTKVCHAEGYHVRVKRQLSSCRQIMTVTSTAIWPDKQVQAQQIYRKIEA